MWQIEGVIESSVCLLPMITDESRQFIQLYNHYKNNTFWLGTGIATQPNGYMEAMTVISNRIEYHANQRR